MRKQLGAARRRRAEWGVSLAALVALPLPAMAQQPAQGVEELVVIGASRLPESLKSYPGSVTRIGAAEIRGFESVSSDVAQLLAQQVPGLGTATPGTTSNFEQALRGRPPAVLVDGVPVSTPLRDGRHDIRSLSMSVIDQIEVIRGATALYGNGGGGGVINYITKKGRGPAKFETEIGTELSLVHASDSFAPFLRQSGLGQAGPIDFNFEAYVQQTNSQFDADGSRIRPSPNQQGGLADSQIYNLFGKLGSDITDAQRVEVSALYYNQEQDTDYNRLINGNVAARIPTKVAKSPKPPGAVNELNRNLVLNGVYTHNDVFGSSLRVQAYYQDEKQIYVFDPNDYLGGGQSQIVASKHGARADVKTPIEFIPIFKGASMLWGVDYIYDETQQNLVDGRIWSPRVTQSSVAEFIQLTVPFWTRFTFRGGFRHEDISVENPAFNTLRRQPADVSILIPAGKRDFTANVFNAGLTFDMTENLNLFIAYSQGFSTAEVGRVLRDTRVPISLSSATLAGSLDPQQVDNYEAGFRAEYLGQRLTGSIFYNKCSLCSTIDANLRLIRQPDRTYGVEFTLDGNITEQLRYGATATVMKGDQDINADGKYDLALPSNRVPPAKVTGFVEYAPDEHWTLRLQGLHSFKRDPFGNQILSTAVGVAPVQPFTLVDVSVRYKMDRWGAISVGINNLFNEDYFTIGSYLLNRPDRFSKGPGTTARLAYTISY
jgi:iron complex outermembrane recepter protein